MLQYILSYSPVSPLALLLGAALIMLAAPLANSARRSFRFGSMLLLVAGLLLAGQAVGYALMMLFMRTYQWFT